jgi:mono/diheme cytochrome c family protein
VSRITLVLPAIFFFVLTLSAQQAPATQKTPPVVAIPVIPVEAARQPNPVKPSPESLARAKKWWGLDCAMCHGKEGNGKGDVAKDMKLQIVDFTDPATLKDRTDGELFYIIKNGHQDMPPEGQRVKTEENWDLVNYVRSFAKKKPEAEPKPQS